MGSNCCKFAQTTDPLDSRTQNSKKKLIGRSFKKGNRKSKLSANLTTYSKVLDQMDIHDGFNIEIGASMNKS